MKMDASKAIDKEGCNCVGGWWNGDKYAGTNFKLEELEAIASTTNVQHTITK
jgi:hypothetical protein